MYREVPSKKSSRRSSRRKKCSRGGKKKRMVISSRIYPKKRKKVTISIRKEKQSSNRIHEYGDLYFTFTPSKKISSTNLSSKIREKKKNVISSTTKKKRKKTTYGSSSGINVDDISSMNGKGDIRLKKAKRKVVRKRKRKRKRNSVKTKSTKSDVLKTLPKELFVYICSYLKPDDVISFSLTSKTFQYFVDSRETWITMYERDGFPRDECIYDTNQFPKTFYIEEYFNDMKRVAFEVRTYSSDRDGWEYVQTVFGHTRIYFSGRTTSQVTTNTTITGEPENQYISDERDLKVKVPRERFKKLRKLMAEKKMKKDSDVNFVDTFKTLSIGSDEKSYLFSCQKSEDVLFQKLVRIYFGDEERTKKRSFNVGI